MHYYRYASQSIRGQLVKMLITFEPLGMFSSNLHAYLFYHSPSTGMQNGDEALLSIILSGRGLTVKMLITLEPHNKHIF